MTGRSKSSALATLRLIATTEGLPGLFRGNGASCLRIVPYAAIHFSVYEAYRRILVEHFAAPAPPPQAARPAAPGSVSSSSSSQHPQHLGEDVPPTPMTSSIEVSATAVITTVEEEQREEAEEEVVAKEPPAAALTEAATAAEQQHHHHRRQRPGPVLDLVAGSAAGATAVLMTYPLDMVRTRLAWAMDGASRRGTAAAAAAGAKAAVSSSSVTGVRGMAAAASAATAASPPAHHVRIVPMLVHTARHEGVVGLYRGLAPTLYGIMPYAGLKFFVYGSLKQWYRDTIQQTANAAAAPATVGKGGGGGGERLPVPYMLAFGGMSGLLAQTVTYPLDVIRRRMQVHGLQQEAAAAAEAAAPGVTSPPRPRLTTWGVGNSILRQDGVRGLFRGLSLNYVKVVPSTAIGFTVYDMLKSYLGVTGNI